MSSVVQPVQRLVGFERIQLKPGETRSVSFAIGSEQLAIWDRQMQRTVEPGVVDVSVGPNVANLESVAIEVKP
jgi:beta-glucosidase